MNMENPLNIELSPKLELIKAYREALNDIPAKQIHLVINDLDDCLYHRGEPPDDLPDTPETVMKKVRAYGRLMKSISKQTGLTFPQAIVTGRTAPALFDKPALKEFLQIHSVINQGKHRLVTLPMPIIYAELGAVQLINTDFGWQSQITPFFADYCQTIRPELESWLYENYIQSGDFHFEEGAQVTLSLQYAGKGQFDKAIVANEIKTRWVKEGLVNFRNQVEILTEGADLDLLPKSLFRGGKIHGIYAATQFFRKLKRSLPLDHVVLMDDSGEKVSRWAIMENFQLALPENARKKMKLVVGATENGAIGKYAGFWGVMDALHQIFLGTNIPDSWIQYNHF